MKLNIKQISEIQRNLGIIEGAAYTDAELRCIIGGAVEAIDEILEEAEKNEDS